jgi:hypothetical protein
MMSASGRIKADLIHIPAFATTGVIARIDLAIQYSPALATGREAAANWFPPLGPVTGLAEGETRWRATRTYR